MKWDGTYEELQDYLRLFVNIRNEPVPYDVVGVIHLMLATLDNLRSHALEQELDDIGEAFDGEQAAFFLKLAGYISPR